MYLVTSARMQQVPSVWKKMQLEPSAGKHVTSDKRGKTNMEHLIGQEDNKFPQSRYDLEY